MTVQERVRGYVLESFYLSDPGELTDEISLIDSGIIDSTGMLDIILFLEGEYGIHITDRETIPDNLETLSRIAAFVERKQATTAGAHPEPHELDTQFGEANDPSAGPVRETRR